MKMVREGVYVRNAGVFRRAGDMFRFIGAGFTDVGHETQRELGKMILKKAQELVPVQTGALKASGRLLDSKRFGVRVRFGNFRVGYAAVVEFGRFAYAPFAPRPYIRPAVAHAQRFAKKVGHVQVKKMLGKRQVRRII
tara:strand:+ start:4095 stop:4508 length:414 start_codon:yes stop_codon:yes gene_type:complete